MTMRRKPEQLEEIKKLFNLETQDAELEKRLQQYQEEKNHEKQEN